jgi:hypothetical protein
MEILPKESFCCECNSIKPATIKISDTWICANCIAKATVKFAEASKKKEGNK